MTLETIVREAAGLGYDDRLRLLETLWDGMSAESAGRPLPAWQAELLDERLRDLEADPDSGVEAGEFLRRLRARPDAA